MPKKIKSKPYKIAKPPDDPLNLPLAFQLKSALIKAGYKGWQLELLLTTGATETGGFKSPHAIMDYNFGGVKWFETMEGTPGMRASTIYKAPKIESKEHYKPKAG